MELLEFNMANMLISKSVIFLAMSIEQEGLYGEFDHVPTGIYIPIDILK
jgi:hypothetical protein